MVGTAVVVTSRTTTTMTRRTIGTLVPTCCRTRADEVAPGGLLSVRTITFRIPSIYHIILIHSSNTPSNAKLPLPLTRSPLPSPSTTLFRPIWRQCDDARRIGLHPSPMRLRRGFFGFFGVCKCNGMGNTYLEGTHACLLHSTCTHCHPHTSRLNFQSCTHP